MGKDGSSCCYAPCHHPANGAAVFSLDQRRLHLHYKRPKELPHELVVLPVSSRQWMFSSVNRQFLGSVLFISSLELSLRVGYIACGQAPRERMGSRCGWFCFKVVEFLWCCQKLSVFSLIFTHTFSLCLPLVSIFYHGKRRISLFIHGQ